MGRKTGIMRNVDRLWCYAEKGMIRCEGTIGYLTGPKKLLITAKTFGFVKTGKNVYFRCGKSHGKASAMMCHASDNPDYYKIRSVQDHGKKYL